MTTSVKITNTELLFQKIIHVIVIIWKIIVFTNKKKIS